MGMDAGRIIKQLRGAGARVELADVGILIDGAVVEFEVKSGRLPERAWLQKIHAAHVAAYRSSHVVVVAPRASVGAIEWVREHPDVTLVLDDRVVHRGEIHVLDETPPARQA
ncbi:MAG: hypothetical protein ACK5LS_12615, partial [Propioniciclava sp.]